MGRNSFRDENPFFFKIILLSEIETFEFLKCNFFKYLNIVPLKMEQSLSQSLIPILFSKRADESRTMERTIATNVSFHRLMKKKKKNSIERQKLLPFFYLTNRRLRSISVLFLPSSLNVESHQEITYNHETITPFVFYCLS